MVLGYWDGKGFDDLVEGEAAWQSNSVNNMISSAGNYYDYCLPLDTKDNILPDKSELPIGDEHDDNCLADFIKTSQSYYGFFYGWSGGVSHGMKDYILFKNSTYNPIISHIGIKRNDSWSLYCKEIDNGRPVVFLVDTDGDNETDHYITAIGYDDNKNYACLDTWDKNVHWYDFSYMGYGNKWGISSITTCILGVTLYSPINPYPEDYSRLEVNNITLRWECEDPDEDNLYHLYLAKYPYFNENDLLVSNLTEKYYYVSFLEDDSNYYYTEYYWKVVAEEKHGFTTESDTWCFYTLPVEPPTIEIVKPRTRCTYINGDIGYIPFLRRYLRDKTIIIGEIMIEFNAYDNFALDKVQLYVNNQLKFNDSNINSSEYNSYQNYWLWNEQLFSKCILKAVVYDSVGNIGTYEITVWKFF